MASSPVRSLEPLAVKHNLGAVVSVHKQEQVFIRRRARGVWLFTAGPLVGLALATT